MISTISKKITLLLGFLGLLIAPLRAQCATNLAQLHELCITHNQILESSLLSLIHEVETSLEYWRIMEDTPFSYTIIRGPKGWLSSKTAQEEIQQHIAALNQKQEYLANALGTLSSYEHFTKDSLNNDQNLANNIALCFKQTFLEKTFTLPQNIELEALATLGADAINQLPEFHSTFLGLIANDLKPNHFIRHWTKYAAGTACIVALATLAYTHQDTLATWQHAGKEAFLNFWKKYIKEPLSNSYSILFDKRHSGIVSTESLEGKRTLLRAGLQDFLKEKFPDATPEENDNVIEYMMTTKDFSLVQEDLKDQFGSWGSRAYAEIYKKISEDKSYYGAKSWSIRQALPEPEIDQSLRLGQDLDLVMQSGLLTADELLQKTQLNLELFAIIPSALGLYGLKKGYDSLFHRKILSEPLQHRLILVDKLLNRYNNNELQLDLAGTGFLRYHIHALSQYVGRIPTHQQKAFKSDLEELNNQSLNVGQKLRVIDQMYRQYAFLSPLAI